jgi:hypothetical protein
MSGEQFLINMATQGVSISKASFSTAWDDNGISYNWSDNTTGNVYYCASSFVVEFSTEYNFWQSGRGTGEIEYYNNETGVWTRICQVSIKGNGTQSFSMAHNRSAETNHDYYDNFESGNFHIWRFHWANYYSNDRWKIKIWGGGPGMMTDTEYNTYIKGRKIISKGQVASNVFLGSNWTTTYYDSEAVAHFNPENVRGTKLFAGYEKYMIPKWN